MKRRHPIVLVALSLLEAGSATAAVRQVFVTSATGNAKLSGWSDAGGNAGPDAGDAICQALAGAATPPLPNASSYKAWLSTLTNDAACRLRGLPGELSTNCGQPPGPLPALGPWVRTDGVPFGEALDQLLSPTQAVYSLLDRDENGQQVAGPLLTGTNSDGAQQDPTCADWTDETVVNGVVDGSVFETGGGWSNSGTVPCSNTGGRLICFEALAGDPLPKIEGWGRLAFVTSAQKSGDLGAWPQAGSATGVAAGDAICRSLATSAGLPYPQSFVAWLSDNATDAVDRFANDGPWMRLDRFVIAADKADLVDGNLASALNLTELGAYIGNETVWTGTTAAGVADAARCSEWLDGSSGANGRYGSPQRANFAWTQTSTSQCGFAFGRLYCLQDLPLVFGDGFESANTAVWSAAVN